MDAYRIEIAASSDLPGILELESTEYGYPNNSAEYWNWRYFENPVADVKVYVARDPGGRVVAMQPISAYPMAVDGEVRRIHLFTGLITHPEHRGRGLFRRLVDTIVSDLERQGEFVIYTFPNERSVKGFRKFSNWELRERLALCVRPILPVLGRRAVARVGSMGPRSSGALVGVEDITLGEAEHFEEDTKSLLASALCPDSISIERSREYLEWRYSGNPTGRYMIHQAHRGRTLVGYVVAKVTRLFGLRSSLIVDLLATDNEIALALLRRAVRASGQAGALVAGHLAGRFSPHRDAFTRAGFVALAQRLSPKSFYLYTYPKTTSGGVLAKAVSERPWYLSWGDIDIV